MLGRENHHLHTGVLHRAAPLVRIEFFQREHLRGLHAAAPLLSGKCVGSEMHEGNELIFKCLELVLGRYDIGRLPDYLLFAVALDAYGIAVFLFRGQCRGSVVLFAVPCREYEGCSYDDNRRNRCQCQCFLAHKYLVLYYFRKVSNHKSTLKTYLEILAGFRQCQDCSIL